MNLAIVRSGKNKRLYIQKSFRKNGRSSSKNVECLGNLNELMNDMKMSEEEVMAWGREKAREYTENEEKENNNVIIRLNTRKLINKDELRTYSAGYLFLQSIYSALRFDNTFRNIRNRHGFRYDIDAIFSDLVFARIIEPGSKKASYETAKTFLETPGYELHDVYRCLSVLSEEMNYIEAEIYRNSNLILKRNNRVLYYDCTNYYFEIEEEDDSRKYGKGKEHRPNPIIQMGLFMDGDGIPIAFNLFEGNKNEQQSMKPLEERIIRDYDFSSFVVCTDAGLSSRTNRLFNSIQNRAFIISQSLKKLKKSEKEWVFEDRGWKRVSDDKKVKLEEIRKLEDDEQLYYKEMPYQDDRIYDQRLIVSYSPVYARYQKNIREKQVNRAMKIVESGKIRKARNENDPYRFIRTIATTENGETADERHIEIDQDVINEEARYDGLYACTTNLNDDIREIMKVAKGRWEIEESFRIMKTDFKARPVHLSRKDRIRAHFLTCYTALVILRLLEKKTEGRYTTDRLINTLRSYNLLKIDEGYIPAYTRSEISDHLHEIFGFRTDYQIIKPSRMRSIIAETKKKK